MTETITRLYDSYDRAQRAVAALKSHGFNDEDISVIARTEDATSGLEPATSAAGEGAEIGLGVGGAVGAGAGLLAGLGIMAIPGIGPVVAAGWLAATAAGAVAGAFSGAAGGGIIGALVGSGVPDEDAHVYAEGMRRGGSLITVRVEENRAVEARRVLDETASVDMALRGAEYRKDGWSRFDPKAPAYGTVPPVIVTAPPAKPMPVI